MKTSDGVPTPLIMVFGTRKIPLPMTVPTTMEAAAQAPSSSWSSVVMKLCNKGSDDAGEEPDAEGHRSPYQDVPSPRDRGEEADVEDSRQAGDDAGDGGKLPGPFGEDP